MTFIFAVLVVAGAGCMNTDQPMDSGGGAAGTYLEGQAPDNVGADDRPLNEDGTPLCPDICAAICSGEPEPELPPECPTPLCACDE